MAQMGIACPASHLNVLHSMAVVLYLHEGGFRSFLTFQTDLQIVYAFLYECDILISEIKLGGDQYGEIHSLREAFQEGKAQD